MLLWAKYFQNTRSVYTIHMFNTISNVLEMTWVKQQLIRIGFNLSDEKHII